MAEEKYYTLSTHTAEKFDEVHEALVNGSLLGRNVECTNHISHSPTRGEFLLTEEEMQTLKADDRIRFINLTPARYPEIFNATEDDLRMDVQGVDYSRYGQTVRNWHFWANNNSISGGFSSNALADKGRASSQLIRCKQKRNPWISSGTSETNYIDADPVQQGAGENVDIICMDNGTWIGHVEFINPNRVAFDFGAETLSPQDYIGGNVLPGNGYCDVLDVILDSPYYIDPDWFDADAGNRLETRWDGTIVPTEAAARSWWGDTSQRSAKFAEFGSITIDPVYTRVGMHGSNADWPSVASATHGTQCASLIYGRTHGWAYNSNKWHLNLYGVGSNDIEIGFDVCKIFHKYKPINPLYGTRDPSIGSNSWGFRANKADSFYFFQSALGTPYVTEPEFMLYMGEDGDGGRWKSEMLDNSMTEAGKELVDTGFIFVVAAGNSGQMQVNPDDPNYDNHIGSLATNGVYDDQYLSFGYDVTGTTNRRGFPQHIGKTQSQTSQGNTTVEFPAINIGALDDVFNGGKEQKVNYSDMGNAIDLYAPADGTLAATVANYGTDVLRYDDSYATLGVPVAGSTQVNAVQIPCRDTRFSGTSAACPVAAGFLATVVQYNRSWTYRDIRSWIRTNIDIQDSADFYDDTRGTTADGTEWSDRNRLQGGDARVAYLAPYGISTPYPSFTIKDVVKGPISIRGSLQIKFRNA